MRQPARSGAESKSNFNKEILKMTDATKEKSLAVQPEGELQIAQTQAFALQEIQGAMILAKKFPRNYDECWADLMKACERKSLAEQARYSYPRGGQTVSGPTVNIARVAGQIYKNVRWGLDVLRNDEDQMHIRGWAWDIENNIKVTADDVFKKLIYRKKDGWKKPDERDLRELQNRRGAILVRNCLLQIVPKDLIEDALGQCAMTLKSSIKDPEGEKKRLILQFSKYGVTVEMVNKYLEHDVWDNDDIVELTGIYNAIKDGASKREEYFELSGDKNGKSEDNGVSTDKMKPGNAADHQGHESKDKPEGKKGKQNKIDF
jgi:hypothetical protein